MGGGEEMKESGREETIKSSGGEQRLQRIDTLLFFSPDSNRETGAFDLAFFLCSLEFRFLVQFRVQKLGAPFLTSIRISIVPYICVVVQMDSKNITLNEVAPHEYLVTWEVSGGLTMNHSMTMSQIEAKFPEWCCAIRDCHQDLNPAVPLDHFLRIAAISFCETIMKKRRFQVYRHVAWAAGFAERTQLPPQLELAIKNEWHTEEESFVGFIPL